MEGNVTKKREYDARPKPVFRCWLLSVYLVMEPSSLKDLISTQRAELTDKYFPQDKSLLSKLLPGDLYEQTQELAYHSISFGKQYIIKNSVISLGINLFFIHGVQLLMYFSASKEDRRSAILIFAQIAFTLGSIYAWSKILNNKPQVIIDNTGIEIINSGDKIDWENIAMVYIRVGNMIKKPTDYLVINYYAPWNNGFEEKEIDLSNLDTSKADISSAVEYYGKEKIA